MRWTTTAMVAAFAVVDVGVLGGAYVLSQGRVGTDDPALATSPAASASPSGTATGTATGSGKGKNTWTGPLALAAAPSGALLRVTRGSCDERVAVQARAWVARDYKAPLEEVSVPGLQESLGIAITDTKLTIVGAGPSCKVFGFTSGDDGKTWKKGEVPDDVWYLDTDSTAGVVHGPVEGGDEPVDCTPVAVATRDAGRTAYVSCMSQNVMVLDRDAKQDEAPIGYSVTGPAGATDGPGDRPFALAELSGCSAAYVELETSRGPSRQACLGTTAAALGLAASGDRVWAQVGYQLMVSDDGKKFAAYPGQ